MIFIRFIEDAFVLGRFAYFYSIAPKRAVRPGFRASDEKMPMMYRMKWAWGQTIGGVQTGSR